MPHCLVVDDSGLVRRLCGMMLARLGFAVAEAGDGAAALELCRAALPDVLVVDWNMPVMDGVAFIRALRALPGGDRPKVFLCSIENTLDHIQRAIAAGADDYIMKPFNLEILRAKLAGLGLCTLPEG